MKNTITKAEYENELRMKVPMTGKAAKITTTLIFDRLAYLVTNGYALKLPKCGYLTAKFKAGGRLVRNPKSMGDEMAMPDTYWIGVSKHRNPEHVKVNWSGLLQDITEITNQTTAEVFLCKFEADLMRIRNDDERMEIRGFGAFSCKKRGGRNARNPRTGEKVIAKDSTALFFKAGRGLRATANENLTPHELNKDI